jgi:hypothetical protein
MRNPKQFSTELLGRPLVLAELNAGFRTGGDVVHHSLSPAAQLLADDNKRVLFDLHRGVFRHRPEGDLPQ